MSKKQLLILIVILVVATVLRLYKLENNPPALYWDEASLGYNAFAILTTGHDEHGEWFPMARFIAFGDYKPPGYIYSVVPAMALFGVNEFAIRFPSAFSGILMVLGTYLLSKKLFNNENMALIAAALLAISPWSLQLSRAAFEAHLAAIFNLLGILLFLSARKKGWLFVFSGIFFIAAFYTFNANRIISPIFVGVLGLIYWRDLLKNKIWVVVGFIVGILLLWPSFSYLQTRESRLRFDEVSIFTNLDIIKKSNARIERDGGMWLAKFIHNRRLYYAKEFLAHYLDNFKGEFLFIHGDVNPRLSTGDVGELYIFELPFILFGIYYLVRKHNQTSALLLSWLFVAPIPAGVARETPHMLRIASILPAWQIIGAIGVIDIWKKIKQKSFLFKVSSMSGLIFVVGGCLVYYLHNYWVHYPRDWSGEWQYGYKQMVKEVATLEPNYDQIVVNSNLGRPYIYFLLYNRINPLEYVKIRRANRDWYGFWNVDGFGKYDFSGKNEAKGKILKVGPAGTFGSNGKKLVEIKDVQNKVVFEIGEP